MNSPTERGAGRGVKVLLVEDDRAIAAMYRSRLEVDGYSVVVAVDGLAALAAAVAGADVIILDINLPVIDGLEVLRRLRSTPDTWGIPVLLLSNHSDPDLVRRGLELGAAQYRIKAEVSPSELSRLVAQETSRG